MRVEVVYALADVQDVVDLRLPEGALARDAVAASGMDARYGLDIEKLVLGVAGRRVALECRLCDGDRVEILRPLASDPNEARRRRARRR